MEDDPKLTDVGAEIADGAAIDWSAVVARLTPEREDLLDGLRLVEQIVRSHASLPPAGPPSANASTTREREEPLAVWGPLTILEQVGRGTFGDVYRARDPRLDRPVALKLLRRRDAAAESAVIEEARLMARVRHPNVITVYGAERLEGRVGIWMEFVEGQTLEQELRTRGPFGDDDVIAIGVTLARAVEAVHRAGLVHRDLKAQNVMRDRSDGRIVLGDFGAGHALGDSGDARGYDLAGTPLYLAPEVLTGQPATPRSDLYSLGILMFHLTTGTFPVMGRSVRELRDAHAHAKRRHLSDAAPSCRERVAAIIERAADPRPGERFESARRLEDALLHCQTLVPASQIGTGHTLAERVARQPLSSAEALGFAHQIAGLMEAAHQRGVVLGALGLASFHLEANGKLRLIDPPVAGPGAAADRYASPEQERDRSPAPTSDIWVFGCLLYELLNGVRAPAMPGLPGVPGMIDDLKSSSPSPDRRPAVPDLAQFLLRRCLRRDPADRLSSMTDARLMLEDAASASPARRRVSSGWMAAAGAALALLAVWAGLQSAVVRSAVGLPPRGAEANAVHRLTIPVTTGHLRGNEALAVSPDGSRLVFAVQEGKPPISQLYVRSIDAFESRAIEGTTNGSRPFFSPDGRSVGFFAGDDLKRVSLAGGPPVQMCKTPSSQWGGAWAPDGAIVFASDQGLWRIEAPGGDPVLFAKTDVSNGVRSYRWPQVLADGAVLFTAWKGPLQSDVVIWRPGRPIAVVLENATKARYVPSGDLIFGRQSTLLSVPFDPATNRMRGAPDPIVTGVRSDQNGSLSYAVSMTGTLAYDPGELQLVLERQLEWIDRSGRTTPLPFPARRYASARVSPDGLRIAAAIQEQAGDAIETSIWVGDLERGTLTRLTFGGSTLADLAWTPDNQRVTYRRERGGGLYSRRIDLSGPEEELVAGTYPPSDNNAAQWSADGEKLLFAGQDAAGKTGSDIWIFDRGQANATNRVRPFLQTGVDEYSGVFSPNADWVAYAAKDSGRAEIYIRPLAGSGPVVQISNSGGTSPDWLGDELIYEQPIPDQLMSVNISLRPALRPGKPARVLDVGPGRTFEAVSPDGQRFLFLFLPRWAENVPPDYDMVRVLTNWPALRQIVR